MAAALANDRGTFSTVDGEDSEKLAVLELALERISDDDANRSLLLATLCSELTVGSSVERCEALAREAIAVARRHGDDATIVRVLNHVLIPLAIPSLLEQSLERSAEALARAEPRGRSPIAVLGGQRKAIHGRVCGRHRGDGQVFQNQGAVGRATRPTLPGLGSCPATLDESADRR